VLVHTHSPPSIAKVIGIPTYQNPYVYTVAFRDGRDGSVSEYTKDLLSKAPECMTSVPSLLPAWMKGGAKATLFLEKMSKPRHGTLQLVSNEWQFYPGKSHDGILLPDLQASCQHLLDTGQSFCGHAKFKNVYNTSTQVSLRDCVLCHISAHGLKSLVPPTSLKAHKSLDADEKLIWDQAYDEEYDGFEALPTWEVITEAQYKILIKEKRALPTMAIASIKYMRITVPKEPNIGW